MQKIVEDFATLKTLSVEQAVGQLKTDEGNNDELEKLRNELGEIGGAGHFWGNDKGTGAGGVRNWMGEKELKKVLQLLSLGERTINLKEREF